jgi:membrane associated rhomboid family serine protease
VPPPDMDEPQTLPPPPTTEHCYRHPGVATGVHCTRCGRPICTECMIPAPVGHQCPSCVDEARREFRQGPGRRVAAANLRRRLSVTTVLLGLIGGMYLLEVISGGAGSLMSGPSTGTLIDLGASVGVAQTPSGDLIGIATGQYWRLISAVFLHAGLLHLAFNAYALWIFGSVVEEELGPIRYLLIFLITGFFASAASYAFGPNAVGVGASGAIFGVFGAFVAFNFRRRHLALAAARLRGAVTLVVINMALAFAIPGIDWRAHVGGFVAGVAAGYAAEGTGSPSTRRAILVLGFAGIVAVGIALVAWQTAELRQRLGLPV